MREPLPKQPRTWKDVADHLVFALMTLGSIAMILKWG